ncbi:flagellar P-ring protein precursor FlgI [Methylomarinovum caldicuralii]|uniref:Flagellar P-ring protein n=1 Tax=Methylomarinovum caldicuralii TaxID=438856 RepID=A0AAU9CY22_9GAMM|nr:flagellar basal body P-ring protein FlgI [Methylomarinovum caldicuralii]BCX82927.1 flagellar P-ring protein precursor FlgI [Methylomarinovum caldicuralii]
MKARLWLGILLLALAPLARGERIKDLASIAGVRANQLIGYGLVVGLNGTGDKTKFTGQTLRNMLARLGITLPPGVNPKSKNVAAVAVHAELPPFAKPGQTLDVTVSSLGDAKSLRGGTLLMTPLKGIDGQIYAVAQGNLLVGGLTASGQDGSRITVNIPSAGRIPNGATVERAVPSPFGNARYLTLNLHRADFTTAQRIAASINRILGPDTARPLDATSVQVGAPADPAQKVTFVSMIENLEVEPGEAPARVIVNARTGTVVVSRHVRVRPAAVSHGKLVVTIRENPKVSQPAPFAGGTTTVVPQSDVSIEEQGKHMFVFDPGVSLNDLVRAVNAVGAAPSDLVAILEALKNAGALEAELIVI